MLQKWKCILTNWINCYFSDSTKDAQTVNLDSLLNLISHLRSNLNLDESKSSILGAHTVEQFILEKYPDFKFENGTVEATNEEDVYLVASLLLFFVCVNSKEVDIKYAMCSRLNAEDQETIFKFSKSLMECSPILCRDVQSAITEACGSELATMTSITKQVTVAETPPALRSLHGEVRRLQAALDAERFDRNYLQEELARTNMRVEKLLKDKEQYKLDIVNLKAKISFCCGQEDESQSTEEKADLSAKLSRQLKEMEERLVQTQGELDDVKYDRDTYKTKAEELKQDRDKWLQISQHETVQVSQLTEELEEERRNVQTLKELVVELRLHNRLNRLDSSLLECDDPDASIHSLHHNLSACSEICANVVEVQLGEERAKIVVLEQKIQSLQDQLHDLHEKSENDKRTFETINTDRETEIFNLKHRINEEIEDKNNLQAHFNDEVIKLNNEINELEQRLKGTTENSRAIIERKMQEIQILQEEKLSLLQSLSNETTKLENIIKGMEKEIETEKQAKLNMKDSYENHIMKLNEKVLNRNNELVEFQNNVLEKSELIETLHLELRKSKDIYDELSNKYHNDMLQMNEDKNAIENILQQKFEEVTDLRSVLEQKLAVINDLNKKIENLQESITDLNENCKILDDTKTKLLNDIHNRDTKLGKIYKDTENLKNMYNEETDKLKLDLSERNAMINTLQLQLQNEIQYKIQLQHELAYLQKVKTELAENLNSTNGELSKLKTILKEKDKIIDAMDMCLNENKNRNEKLSLDINHLKEKLQEANDIKSQNCVLEDKIKYLQEELEKNGALIEEINNKLQTEVAEKEALKDTLTSLTNEKACLEKVHLEKSERILKLEAEKETLSQVIEVNKTAFKTKEQYLKDEHKKYIQLEKTFDEQTTKMVARLNETEKIIKELSRNSKKTINTKELEIQALKNEFESMKTTAKNDRDNALRAHEEKEALSLTLEKEKSYKNYIEKEYQNQCIQLDNLTKQLNNEIVAKNDQINALKVELQSVSEIVDGKCAEIEMFENKLSQQSQRAKEQMYQKNMEIKEIQMKINDLESYNEELEQERNKDADNNNQVMQSLQKENEQLHFTIEEDNSNHEVLLKEKDRIIDSLEQQLKDREVELESMKKDFEGIILTWEKFKGEARENVQDKDDEINQLNEQIAVLQNDLIVNEKAKDEMNKQVDELLREKEKTAQISRNENDALKENLALEKDKYSEAVREKAVIQTQLVEDKLVIDALETEKKKIVNENANFICVGEELLNAKAMLTQELSEETSLRKILEEEINVLKSEKMGVEQDLISEIEIKNALLEDKECLTQQLIEEKSTRHVTEKEKENLIIANELLERKLNLNDINIEKLTKEINNLIKDHASLKENYMKEKNDKTLLENEKERLDQELVTEKLIKDEILKEKETLVIENKSLELKALDNKLIQEALASDKELLLLDKETLLKSLSEEKSARDEVETEKQILSEKNDKLEAIRSLELSTKVKELNNIQEEFKCLKESFDTQKRHNALISSILDISLNKLIENLKKENITNEVLRKLIMVDKTQDMTARDKCDLIVNIADTLTTEVSMRKNLEKALEHENSALSEMREMCKQKEIKAMELHTEVKRLEQVVNENKIELSKQIEKYNSSLNSKVNDIQTLQQENHTLCNDLTNVKQQLEIKVHSLKEKLTDNELLTDKLKSSYECQINNLNLMINKLTNYMKDKTVELDTMRKEREQLLQTVEDNKKVIKSLEDALKSEKQYQSKLISDFESERLVLKNMVTVTESVMEDQKFGLNEVITEHLKTNKMIQEENKTLKELIEIERNNLELTLHEKNNIFEAVFKELSELKEEREALNNNMDIQKQEMTLEINSLKDELNKKNSELEAQNKDMANILQKYKDDKDAVEKHNNDLKIKNSKFEVEVENLKKELDEKNYINVNLDSTLKEKMQHIAELQDKVKDLTEEVGGLLNEKNVLELEKKELTAKLQHIKIQLDSNLANENEELAKLKKDNVNLLNMAEENKNVITNLELLIKHELEQNHKLREENNDEKLNLIHKCSILEDYRTKAESELEEHQKEISSLKKELEMLKTEVNIRVQDLRDKDECITKIGEEKDELISTMSKELLYEKEIVSKMQRDLDSKTAAICELKKQLDKANDDRELKALRKENDELIQAIGQRETFAAQSQDKTSPKLCQVERERLLHQVDNSLSDITQSSTESLKTITDLEKIIYDKNRTITTLQTDITYLKSLMAESENKLLDVTRELEVSKENCQQLSGQLKKIVYQKNEEIADLKKQVTKMSVTENRASQIIKVSAKYQAIILKRIAEIKSNTVLKELTNFGNSNTCDNELRRSLNAGTITMEDLEYFLETNDRHLKRCAEKQIILQKERDRLSEVNRINESEIINLKKFLTELSVSFQTFSSVKDLYAQKLSRIVSVQRTVRREILSLDGHITDAVMCKLERGYAAVMQDLSECAMNLERWVERCISRTLSPEKIRQAFTSDTERVSLAPSSVQNAGLEVQLEELDNSFQRLLEEVARASKGEGAKDAQAVTLLEVRAEYEDKLNRMKSKMKQLYQEQISIFKEKQREEISIFEEELQKTRHKLAESSKAYEEHIRSLTTELWSVGEKFLMKKDEAEWLRRKQRSGSLMSLQHVHSSGLVPPQEEPSRPSDSHSLRSLPVNNNSKREGRGLHMSDEEGEVFDNRCLKELSATPRRSPPAGGGRGAGGGGGQAAGAGGGMRLSELRWRNSLCPPHLKSCYPAETQFVPALHEEDIKYAGSMSLGGKQQRKEVGITAYKKPGPPTPSKQAGRLSATDSELRESLRVEGEPQGARKTATPSRLRALFRSNRNDTTEGTPRSRRLSNIFRKK